MWKQRDGIQDTGLWELGGAAAPVRLTGQTALDTHREGARDKAGTCGRGEVEEGEGPNEDVRSNAKNEVCSLFLMT